MLSLIFIGVSLLSPAYVPLSNIKNHVMHPGLIQLLHLLNSTAIWRALVLLQEFLTKSLSNFECYGNTPGQKEGRGVPCPLPPPPTNPFCPLIYPQTLVIRLPKQKIAHFLRMSRNMIITINIILMHIKIFLYEYSRSLYYG